MTTTAMQFIVEIEVRVRPIDSTQPTMPRSYKDRAALRDSIPGIHKPGEPINITVSQLLAVLERGPMTTREVGNELGLHPIDMLARQRIGSMLRQLLKNKVVQVNPGDSRVRTPAFRLHPSKQTKLDLNGAAHAASP